MPSGCMDFDAVRVRGHVSLEWLAALVGQRPPVDQRGAVPIRGELPCQLEPPFCQPHREVLVWNETQAVGMPDR